jgi:hypothetical protein
VKTPDIIVDGNWPPWPPRSQAEAKLLEDLTNAKLDETIAYDRFIWEMLKQPREAQPLNPLLPTFEYAMEVYRDTGDKTLLQQIEPKLAKTLPQRKPSGKRGGGRPANERHGDEIWEAVWDVKLIKQIWKEQYGGKFYRPSATSFEVTAESIAKKRHGIAEGSRAEATFHQRLKK